MSVAYSQMSNFKTENIFKAIPVKHRSDEYFVYDHQDMFRSDADNRAAGAPAPLSGYNISSTAYFCNRVALGHPVSDPERANADAAINPDRDATEYITEQIELKKEKDWVATFFTTGVWSGASSSTDMTGQANPSSTTANFRQWNDVASTPIEDIRGEIVSIAKNRGRKPNGIAWGPQVFQALADHEDILQRIKFTQTGIVTEELIAQVLGLDEALTLWAVEDSATEGAAESMGFMAGKAALLYYAEPNPGIKKPSAGYRFVWTGPPGTPATGARIKRYRWEINESDMIEGESWFDDKVVDAKLGAFFATAVA
jgi:hypothetical protein